MPPWTQRQRRLPPPSSRPCREHATSPVRSRGSGCGKFVSGSEFVTSRRIRSAPRSSHLRGRVRGDGHQIASKDPRRHRTWCLEHSLRPCPCRVQAGTTCKLAPRAGWYHVQVGNTCRLATRAGWHRATLPPGCSLNAGLLVAQLGQRQRRVRLASWLCTTACSP